MGPRGIRGAYRQSMSVRADHDAPLFEDGAYYVSTTRIVANGTTFIPRRITSVRVGPPPANPVAVSALTGLVALAALFGLATCAFAKAGCGDADTPTNGVLIVGGLLFVAAMLMAQQRSVASRTSVVYVGLPTGEVVLVSGTNKVWIDAFAEAVRAAANAPSRAV